MAKNVFTFLQNFQKVFINSINKEKTSLADLNFCHQNLFNLSFPSE
jgi:hypothetical protein